MWLKLTGSKRKKNLSGWKVAEYCCRFKKNTKGLIILCFILMVSGCSDIERGEVELNGILDRVFTVNFPDEYELVVQEMPSKIASEFRFHKEYYLIVLPADSFESLMVSIKKSDNWHYQSGPSAGRQVWERKPYLKDLGLQTIVKVDEPGNSVELFLFSPKH